MQNRKPLSLHIPEPALRPGDKADFSKLRLSQAGAVRKPDISVHPREINDLAY